MGFWKNGPDTLAAGVLFCARCALPCPHLMPLVFFWFVIPAHSGLSVLKVCTLLMCGILNFRSRQRDL